MEVLFEFKLFLSSLDCIGYGLCTHLQRTGKLKKNTHRPKQSQEYTISTVYQILSIKDETTTIIKLLYQDLKKMNIMLTYRLLDTTLRKS